MLIWSIRDLFKNKTSTNSLYKNTNCKLSKRALKKIEMKIHVKNET